MVTIPPSEFSARDLYLQGRQLETEEHQSKEAGKLGTLRGGNSGCITDDGEIYGKCPRITFARSLGYQAPIEPESFEWFDAGFANEEAWMTKLKLTADKLGYTLLAEEECPIKWEIEGKFVTGRPDIMLWEDDKPIVGFELKSVSAVNSAVNIKCEDKPKIDNLLQAAHYSMAHNCPFILVYSYRSRSVVPGWAFKFKDQLRLSWEKTTINKNGKPYTRREYSIDPFTKEFHIGFEDDKLYYITESGKRVNTPLTGEGIKRYYSHVATMDQKQDLGPRVTNKDLAGDELPWDPCANCPFVEACDQFEDNYQAWLDKVSVICNDT